MEGEGGGSFYSVQDREGFGWVGWPPQTTGRANVKYSLATISTTGGSVCTITTGNTGGNDTPVMSNCQGASRFECYRVKAQLQEQCSVISLEYVPVASNSYCNCF